MGELQRPGATVHFSDTGPPSAPVVVFGHGLLFSSSMFHHQIDALRATHRCVAVDWRGHGLTKARRAFTLDDVTQDLDTLLHQIGRPVHYVGHSMGAYLALPLAAQSPHLFTSLTLIGASASAEDPDVAARYHRLAGVFRATGALFVREQVKQIMFSPASRRSARVRRDIEHWMEEVTYPSRTEVRHAIRAVANRHGAQCEASVITTPTQLITGQVDAANPPHRTRRLKELIPHAPLHLLPDVGHVAPLEAPHDVAQLLRSFFWQVERRRG